MASRDDPPLAALDELLAALEENRRTIERIHERSALLHARRLAGEDWAEIVRDEERPLIVESLSDNLARLAEAGSRFRRAQARALHEAGMSMDEIARLYGVSRQRVSALLRAPGEPG